VLSGNAEGKSLKAQAKALERKAVDTETLGKYEKWRHVLMQRQAVGEQVATYGSLGLALEGTAVENLAETVKELTYEREMGAEVNRAEVRGMRVAAKDLRKAASRAKSGGIFGGIASGIGTLASFAG